MASKPAIIVHGGAGRIGEDRLQTCQDGCREAALQGWQALRDGASALDSVELAVTLLEDNPEFNAGIGSVLNRLGEVETDASIMDGANLAAGAVGAVHGIRNPIRLARAVLEDGRYVLLVGDGAQAFARNSGIPACAPEELITPAQRRRWTEQHGTVGAVAIDQQGRLAAATSTGGLFDALPGRVGDSALVGCGTYANDEAAVSCTGIGEAIIRSVLARTAVDLIADGHDPLTAAAAAVDVLNDQTASEAGLIVIDSHGGIGYAHNAEHMVIAAVNAAGESWSAA